MCCEMLSPSKDITYGSCAVSRRTTENLKRLPNHRCLPLFWLALMTHAFPASQLSAPNNVCTVSFGFAKGGGVR